MSGSAKSSAPRLIAIVDTEEEFDWAAPFDRARTAVAHMRRIGALQAVFDRHGMRPVYGVGYPVATQAAGIEALAPIFAQGRALVGAHPHPWVTPPLVDVVDERNSFPGNLPEALERAKLETLTSAIKTAFGIAPTIYKAGRYGIGANTFTILEALGYTVDMSPMPPRDYRAIGGPDFSHRGTEPAWEGPSRRVLSIPNTGAYIGLLPRLGLDRLCKLAAEPRFVRMRLPGILSRLRISERIALTPEGNTLAEMCRLTSARLAAGQRLFVLALHSPSVEPGHTQYVRNEAELANFLARLDAYLAWFHLNCGGHPTDPLTVYAELHAARSPPTQKKKSIVSVTTRPILYDDLPEIAAYWHAKLNAGISVDRWLAAFRHRWMPGQTNSGFMLRANGNLVGTLGAIYARNRSGVTIHDICNLSSLMVDEAYRARTMDLLSALLSQKNLSFTDFTPTPAVAKMLRLFKFNELRSGERIVPHIPIPPAAMGLRAISSRPALDGILGGAAARMWNDHRDIAWLNAFAIGRGERWCLVFWRHAAVKGIRAARILGLSDPALYCDWIKPIGGHLMLRHFTLASRIDEFMLPEGFSAGMQRPTTTPRMFKGSIKEFPHLSYLYSEVVALPL